MILGQTADASSSVDLYTVPAKKIATLRVFVTERAGGTPTFRIALRLAGAALANKQYIVYDKALAANEEFQTKPFELGENDILSVLSSDTNVSFNANGVEEPEVE